MAGSWISYNVLVYNLQIFVYGSNLDALIQGIGFLLNVSSWPRSSIFLLTGLHICTGEYKAQGPM